MTVSRSGKFESSRKVGKAEARQEFGALVESVAAGGGPVEISDYGKVVAVLVNVHKYQWLLSKVKTAAKPKKELCGSIVIHDDLEKLSGQIREDFEKSIEESIKNL